LKKRPTSAPALPAAPSYSAFTELESKFRFHENQGTRLHGSKTNFGAKLEPAVAGTPFSVDMFYGPSRTKKAAKFWPVLVDKQLGIPKILELCVGDTLDGRSAFPKSKAELLAAPQGQEMFRIAHQSLVDMAQYSTGYQGSRTQSQQVFATASASFSTTSSFFKDDPAFFLQKKNGAISGACIAKLVAELRAAMASRSLSWSNKTALSDTEKVYVAIAYNCGHADPRNGFKQGFHSDGRYYGENILEYMRLAQQIVVAPTLKVVSIPLETAAPLPPPDACRGHGGCLSSRSAGTGKYLLLRKPRINKRNPAANVIAQLPAGQNDGPDVWKERRQIFLKCKPA